MSIRKVLEKTIVNRKVRKKIRRRCVEPVEIVRKVNVMLRQQIKSAKIR